MDILNNKIQSKVNNFLYKSWKHHQEALEGMEKVKLAMELSELELESTIFLMDEEDMPLK